MKNLLVAWMLLFTFNSAFAQIDTSTAEKKAKYRISLLAENKTGKISPAIVRNALTSVLASVTTGTETDPTVSATAKAITATNVTNWNTAYGWGNHASAGYYTLSSAIPYSQITGAPTVPNASSFVDITTAQTVAGNKTLTGTTTLGVTTLAGDATPSADNTVTVGLITKMLKNTFSMKGTFQNVVAYNTTGITFQTSGGLSVAMVSNSGNFMLQGGGSFADTGERLQVVGTAKLNGKITAGAGINAAALPVYADNAAATTGGLVAGDFYRTSTGVLMIRY